MKEEVYNFVCNMRVNLAPQQENTAWSNPILKCLDKLTPFFIVVGIYVEDEGRKRSRDIAIKIYCGFVIMSFFALISISIVEVPYFVPCTLLLLYKIVELLSVLYSAIMHPVWMKIMRHQKQCCCILYEVLCELHLEFRLEKIVKVSKAVLFSTAFIGLGVTIFHYYMFIKVYVIEGNKEFVDLSPIAPGIPIPITIISSTLLHMYFFFMSLALVLYQSYYMLWCYLLYKIFSKFNMEMASSVLDKKDLSFENIENLQSKYELCLKVVRCCDRYVCLFIGYTILHSTSILCVLIYVVASSIPESTFIYGIVFGVSIMLVLTGVCPVVIYNNVSIITLYLFV